MNTYRVQFRVNGRNRKRCYDVDASSPVIAVNRAMKGMVASNVSDVDVSCRLFANDVQRHYSDPWVREA